MGSSSKKRASSEAGQSTKKKAKTASHGTEGQHSAGPAGTPTPKPQVDAIEKGREPLRELPAPSCDDMKLPGQDAVDEMLAKVKGDKPVLQYSLMLNDSDIQWRTLQLAEYRRLYDEVAADKGAKPDMQAQKALNEAIEAGPFARPSMRPPKVIGHVRGVRPGDQFNGRGELAALGIHGQIGCGIDSKQGGPCFCIVMSGGYRDDADDGQSVWYTGQGGQNPKTKQQVADQQLKKYRTPIRVCRAKKAEKGVAKRKGEERQYVYEGLYMVEEYI